MTSFTQPRRDRRQADGSQVSVSGIPRIGDAAAESLLRFRLADAAQTFLDDHELSDLAIRVATGPNGSAAPQGRLQDPRADADVLSIEDRASHFVPVDPEYRFDFLVLPEKTIEQLLLAVHIVQLRSRIFDDWGLRQIEPHPSSAINLHGNPGTGKTLAAHAIADHLQRKILISKYSQLESKYHGEGPKNLDALFHAAQEHNAVLFLDEADSLMSRRFENTSHGSEQAVNAMRSELIMMIDRFEGLVIFATNFVQSYDTAFDTRVRQVHFPDPDRRARAVIWRNHLPARLPQDDSIDVERLAEIDGMCGREIRRAVIDAATTAAVAGGDRVRQEDLDAAARAVLESKITRAPRGEPKPASPELQASIRKAMAAEPPGTSAGSAETAAGRPETTAGTAPEPPPPGGGPTAAPDS
jgi:SpoVK/Ycf46/Vps4 family AAA+-type ATPase